MGGDTRTGSIPVTSIEKIPVFSLEFFLFFRQFPQNMYFIQIFLLSSINYFGKIYHVKRGFKRIPNDNFGRKEDVLWNRKTERQQPVLLLES